MIRNQQSRIRVSLAPLERFLARVRRELRLNGKDVTVCFVSARAIARWNACYRGKRRPTDVLSFPANGMQRRPRKLRKRGNGVARDSRRALRELSSASFTSSASSTSYLGDIAIAPEVARRNARRGERSLGDELRILILHGVLHLMGYDHATDRGQMERLEARLRRRLGLG